MADFMSHPFLDPQRSHPYGGPVPDQMYVDPTGYPGDREMEWYNLNQQADMMRRHSAEMERQAAALALAGHDRSQSSQPTSPAELARDRENLLRRVAEVSPVMADICPIGFDVEDKVREGRQTTLRHGEELAELLVQLPDEDMTRFWYYLTELVCFYNRKSNVGGQVGEPPNAVPLFRSSIRGHYFTNPAAAALFDYESPDGYVSKRRARGDNLRRLPLHLGELFYNGVTTLHQSATNEVNKSSCQQRVTRMHNALKDALAKRAG